MEEKQLISLRQDLHEHAQVSAHEAYAHDIIARHMRTLRPTHTWPYVGTDETGRAFGFIAVWQRSAEAPTIAFRADTDALPINETTALPYRSCHEGMAHKCGHDGHTAILLQLADLVDEAFREGQISCNVLLLWQPQEETGLGSRKMLEAQILQTYNIRAFYAIHNIPGYPLNEVVLVKDTFAAASAGLEIFLHGRQTHASTPEKGLNPGLAVAQLIQSFAAYNSPLGTGAQPAATCPASMGFAPSPAVPSPAAQKEFCQSTLICLRLGSEAFGTSAGDAYVAYTLRAFTNARMQQLLTEAQRTAAQVAAQAGLTFSTALREPFHATENHLEQVEAVEATCRQTGRHYTWRATPFRWSEDFADYLMQWPGAMFGIGSGEGHAELHHPDYDFPDELLQPTAQLFLNMIFYFCNKY